MSESTTRAIGCEEIGDLGDGHERLEPFVGTFNAVVKMWMAPGDPMESTGTMENAFELGGRFLKQVYTGDANDGPVPDFRGRGYWGYNTATNEYEGFWIDTASTVMQHDRGTLDGDTWTMIGSMTNPQTGAAMKKKSIIRLESGDRHVMEMYLDIPGMGEVKTMEITYTRVE